jgi:hypothetical protein
MPGGVNGSEVVRHVGNRRVRVSGRFFPNGNGAIDNTQNIGKTGWTVARTGVGQYTITLDRRFLKVMPMGSELQLAALAVRSLQWGAITATATGWTFVLTCIDGTATAQEIAANANNSVSFDIEATQDTVIG